MLCTWSACATRDTSDESFLAGASASSIISLQLYDLSLTALTNAACWLDMASVISAEDVQRVARVPRRNNLEGMCAAARSREQMQAALT